MTPRRVRVVSALLGALACVASGFAFARVDAQAARTITVTPSDQLVDGQYVDVHFSGFQPNHDVRVRQCPSSAASVDDCAAEPDRPQDPGHSRLARSDSTGAGSTPFVIKAEDVPKKSGNGEFQCDAQNPCKLYAFDTQGGIEISFDASASQTIDYALSTIPCPEAEPRVAGSGAAAIRDDVTQWQAETCAKPLSLNVSFTTNNSVNGKQAFVQGLSDADFAMSAVPLTSAEEQQLASRSVQTVNVPVALGSLVLAYNLWLDDGSGGKTQVRNLQLSPATVAGIIEGRINVWSDPAITKDNQANYPKGFPSKVIVPVGRADNCAATWWLSSWLVATAKDAWEAGGASFKTGPTTIFPAGNGVDLRTGPDNVALDIREFPGQQGSNGIPDPGLIGFVYLSDAIKLGLPVAALQNQSGNYVLPTTQSVEAAAAAGTVDENGIFTPNFTNGDANAYPVPVVTYAIAPKAGGPLDPPHALVLQKFLQYATGDGQKAAELRGYAPLPDALSTKSSAAVAEIYQAPAPAPSATPAPSSEAAAAAPPPSHAQPAAPVPPPHPPAGDVAAGTSPTARTESASAPAAQEGPAGPAIKLVSGVLKMLGGGSAPVTVQGLLWFGAVVFVCGRALSVLLERRAGSARRRFGQP
jgi:phosphate transport system substrate-binding protein